MKISLIGNKQGIYIDPRTNNAYFDYTEAENISEVNLTGVNHLVIKREMDNSFRIIQANGFTVSEGIFARLY